MTKWVTKIVASLFVFCVMMGCIVWDGASREDRAEIVFWIKNVMEIKMEIRTDFGGKTDPQWERWKPTNKVKMGKLMAEREPCTFEEAMERAFECQKLINEARR